jgi:transposase InsO family protein
MARKVTSMRVISAVIAVAEGGSVNVAEVCRDAGVSRKTFYKWLARYRAGGLEGVEERSRRPRSSPQQTPMAMEERVVRLRKELADGGLDHGATTIQWHLGRQNLRGVPSVATVHRILVRRGLVAAQPHKRPKGSWRRFEAPAPNEWWQIDSTEWVTASGVARIFNIIDDHSRVCVGSRVVLEATTVEAWTSFVQAAEQWGLPAGTLSDNGLCFSGKLRGCEVLFESNLREAGVRPITGRPFHPQTTGKVERFQQTEKNWLRQQPPAADIVELQIQLDRFRHIYNYERPHQGIGRVTPFTRWSATPASQPADHPLEHPTTRVAANSSTTPSCSLTALSTSASTSCTSAPSGPATPPPCSPTTTTPPCSSTDNSSDTKNSTQPAATNHPACPEPDDANQPPTNITDCHPCPATYMSPMSRDRTDAPRL